MCCLLKMPFFKFYFIICCCIGLNLNSLRCITIIILIVIIIITIIFTNLTIIIIIIIIIIITIRISSSLPSSLSSSSFGRWDRRVDAHGRPYYVDHNTRTTTWQKPDPSLMNHLQQFQAWRQNRQFDHMAGRFLFPNSSQAAPETATTSNDPLGPLLLGWGVWRLGEWLNA